MVLYCTQKDPFSKPYGSGACEKVSGENEERNRNKMKKYILQRKIQTDERRTDYEI